MNKILMNGVAVAALWMFAMLVPTMAMAQGDAQAQAVANDPYSSYISVIGSAEMEVEPNEIWLAITINEEDSKGKVTVAEQESTMKSVLRSLGVDPKEALSVKDMSSTLYKKSTGVTSKAYNLKLGDAATVVAVFNALNDKGITDIKLSKVTRNDIPELKRQLRTEAMKNAKSKAEELAAPLEQTVGKAFYIQDSNSDTGSIFPQSNGLVLMRSASSDSTGSTPDDATEFQKIKLQYSISVKFFLE